MAESSFKNSSSFPISSWSQYNQNKETHILISCNHLIYFLQSRLDLSHWFLTPTVSSSSFPTRRIDTSTSLAEGFIRSFVDMPFFVSARSLVASMRQMVTCCSNCKRDISMVIPVSCPSSFGSIQDMEITFLHFF